MAAEEKVSSRIENKFKLSLLQMEKRFVDLETNISEISEKVKEMDLTPINELRQKADDIEDLIMVEQAAIIELKKMLEGSKSAEIPPELTDKVSKLEESLSNLVGKSEFQKTIEDLKKELADMQPNAPSPYEMELLHDKLKRVDDNFASFKTTVDRTLKELYEKSKDVATRIAEVKTPIDLDLVNSKISSLKDTIGSIEKKKMEIDLKFSEMNKKLELIESEVKNLPTERFFDEVNLNKKDLVATNMRIDSVERVYKDLINTIRELENSVRKFDSLENIHGLSKDIEDKIARFKFVEDELRRLSIRMESMYSGMDEKISNVSQVERKVSEILDSINNLRRELDKQRLEILDRVKKDDLAKLVGQRTVPQVDVVRKGDFETLKTEVQNLRNSYGVIDTLQKEVRNKVDVVQMDERLGKEMNLKNKMQEVYGSISKFSSEIERLKTAVNERDRRMDFAAVGSLKSELEKHNSVLNSVQKEVRNKVDAVQMRDLLKKGDLQNVYRMMKEVDNKVKQVKVDEILKLMEVMKKDMDERLGSLKEKEDSLVDEVVRHTEVGIDELQYNIQTLLEKVVYLESRMAAIEKMMEETRLQPLIIE